MNEVFRLIAEVGTPIAGSLAMGYFIFLTIKQMLAGVVGQIKTLTKFCVMLEDRARTMSNEMIKIVSDELERNSCTYSAPRFGIIRVERI